MWVSAVNSAFIQHERTEMYMTECCAYSGMTMVLVGGQTDQACRVNVDTCEPTSWSENCQELRSMSIMLLQIVKRLLSVGVSGCNWSVVIF